MNSNSEMANEHLQTPSTGTWEKECEKSIFEYYRDRNIEVCLNY